MRFKSLDSWRGLCAILVALYHLGFQGHYGASAFAQGSFLFVDFFFVLSGFVMAQAYAGRLQTKADFTTFLIRRFGRLWPLHITVLAAYFAENAFKAAAIQVFHLVPKTIPFTGAVSWPSLVANVFLLHSMGLTSELTWNGPSWSISAEFWSYMVFAAVLLWLPRALAAASLVISITAAAILMTNSTEFMDTTFHLGFVRGLYGFFLGIIVHRCYLRWGQLPWPPRPSGKSGRSPRSSSSLALAIPASGPMPHHWYLQRRSLSLPMTKAVCRNCWPNTLFRPSAPGPFQSIWCTIF